MIPWGCLVFAFIAGIWYSRFTAKQQMKHTDFVCRICKDGSVEIPWSVLQVAKIKVGDAVELTVNDKGMVLRMEYANKARYGEQKSE